MNAMEFVNNLKYMGLGMLAIIIVIGAIILVTVLLNRLTKTQAQEKKNTSVWVGVILAVLVVALLLSLYFADGDCAACLKNGKYDYEGKQYCKDHYEEILAGKCDHEGCMNDVTHEVDKTQYCDLHYLQFLQEQLAGATK